MGLKTVPLRLRTIDTSIARSPAKRTDPHYLTPEHRAWARAVIRRARGLCQGASCPKPDRARGERLFADHIIELQDGGLEFDIRNGQALCGSCHTAKTMDERAKRLKRPLPLVGS